MPHTPNMLELGLRLALAMILGAVVGLERERGERAAGMRTFALVCLGSALIMEVSAFGFNTVVRGHLVVADPSRIAAQVVSGIGFLGAGTIILRREVVRGLTTAAGLWAVAGIGLAAGIGMYFAAVAATVGVLLILAVLAPIEAWLFHRSEDVLLRVRPAEGQLAAIREAVAKSGTRLESLTLQETGKKETIRLRVLPSDPSQVDQLLDLLRLIPGYAGLEEVRRSPLLDRNADEEI